MTPEGWRATAAGVALLGAISVFHVPGYETSACLRPELYLASLLAFIVGGGVGLITAFELIAAVAGRGRGGTPWPGAHEAARWVATAVMVGFNAWEMAESGSDRPAHLFQLACIFGGTSALVLVASRAVGARGGPSLTALLVVTGTALYLIFTGAFGSRWEASTTLLAPIVVVVIARLRLHLSREDLRASGIYVHAADDVAVAPAAVTVAIALYAHWAKRSGQADAGVARFVEDVFDDYGGWFWVWVLPTAATVLALRYIARRQRLRAAAAP